MMIFLESVRGSQGQFSMNKIMLWRIHLVGSATGGEAMNIYERIFYMRTLLECLLDLTCERLGI